MPSDPLSLLSSAAAEVETVAATAKTYTTPCDEGQVVWREWGSGPPLVLIHGDFGSWTHWLRNIPALAEHFRVIAPDMPGYGDSDPPPEPWSPDSMARILADGVARIVPAPQSYCLAAFSFGGIISGHLAAVEGERVRHLLLSGAGGLALPRDETPRSLKRLSRDMSPEEAIAVHRHNLGELMIADPGKVDDLAVYLQITNARRARIRAGSIPDSDALVKVLPAVTARIHGIWGSRDAMSYPYIAERGGLLRRFQPDMDFRTIEGAGHWVPFEAADAVNTAIPEMFARPPRRDRGA